MSSIYDSRQRLKYIFIIGAVLIAIASVVVSDSLIKNLADEERQKMTALLDSGFIDSYRYFYPDKIEAYTWWSYMRQARSKNIGWRIDYFIVSQQLKDNLKAAYIYEEILGSDHCPVGIDIF